MEFKYYTGQVIEGAILQELIFKMSNNNLYLLQNTDEEKKIRKKTSATHIIENIYQLYFKC